MQKRFLHTYISIITLSLCNEAKRTASSEDPGIKQALEAQLMALTKLLLASARDYDPSLTLTNSKIQRSFLDQSDALF